MKRVVDLDAVARKVEASVQTVKKQEEEVERLQVALNDAKRILDEKKNELQIVHLAFALVEDLSREEVLASTDPPTSTPPRHPDSNETMAELFGSGHSDTNSRPSFPVGANNKARIKFYIEYEGCFVDAMRMKELDAQFNTEGGAKYWMANSISWLARNGYIARVRTLQRGKRFFYGLPGWIHEDENGVKSLADPQYSPVTRKGRPTPIEDVIIDDPTTEKNDVAA